MPRKLNKFNFIDEIEESNKALKKAEKTILENAVHIDNIESLLSLDLKALKLLNELEPLPSVINIKAFLQQINQAYMKSSTIKGEIDSFWDKDSFWKSSSTQGIKIPIGWDNNENIVNFEIGFEYSEHHTLHWW